MEWDARVDDLPRCTLHLVGVSVETTTADVQVSSVQHWPPTQDAPLSEEEARHLEALLLGLKANQFEAVKKAIEWARVCKLAASITRKPSAV
ncbi:MAG: hypothetical protein BGO49_03285 [Planctomycetales bacterium 71-10]|nr:MAG: hypothetical protein BGO49_03285 [Planctomycetales bacterium 71-10]